MFFAHFYTSEAWMMTFDTVITICKDLLYLNNK